MCILCANFYHAKTTFYHAKQTQQAAILVPVIEYSLSSMYFKFYFTLLDLKASALILASHIETIVLNSLGLSIKNN
jgi:hypothetical protein